MKTQKPFGQHEKVWLKILYSTADISLIYLRKLEVLQTNFSDMINKTIFKLINSVCSGSVFGGKTWANFSLNNSKNTLPKLRNKIISFYNNFSEILR